jgi:hypothetical protein
MVINLRSETLVHIKTIRRYIPEVGILFIFHFCLELKVKLVGAMFEQLVRSKRCTKTETVAPTMYPEGLRNVIIL